MVNLKDLNDRISSFVAERNWEQFHSPKNLSMSLSIEAAELMEHFQWIEGSSSSKEKLSPEKYKQVTEEIADVLIYSLMFCKEMDIDPIKAMEEKIKQNEKKYPVDQSKGSVKKYTEFKEEK